VHHHLWGWIWNLPQTTGRMHEEQLEIGFKVFNWSRPRFGKVWDNGSLPTESNSLATLLLSKFFSCLLFFFEKFFGGVGRVLEWTKGRRLVSQSLSRNVIASAKVVNKAICDSRMLGSKPPMCASGTEDLLENTPSPNWPALAPRIGEGTWGSEGRK
jgi:hypothetical protein